MMNGRMKVMIAYDGSGFADAAINDLRHAGLPRDSQILVISVVDPAASDTIPPVSEFDLLSLASRRAETVLRRARSYKNQLIAKTRELASKAADRLRAQFPEWSIESEALQGKPADELLRRAGEWQPDLIVVGSQGRSAFGRFFLGSVSKKIAENANCSVRIVRRGDSEQEEDAPVKIVAGANNLPDAEKIIETIGRRVWTDETQIRLVAVDDGVSPGRVSAVYPDAKAIFEQSSEALVAIGLHVSIDIRSGNLKDILLKKAERCQSDSIFVVAEGMDFREFELSEAAAGLITDAKCTVEIVR